MQSVAIGFFLQSQGADIVPNPGVGFLILCMITFTTGTAFIMWLGEQVSEHGIGNGISLVIFTSIISSMPAAIVNLIRMIGNEQVSIFTAIVLVFLMVVVVMGAILVTTGQRRIPVQYPRQVKGRRVMGGQRSYPAAAGKSGGRYSHHFRQLAAYASGHDWPGTDECYDCQYH